MCQLNSNCDNCGREIVKEIGQTIIDGKLRFCLSYQCLCGSNLELDDLGFPEEYYRQVFLTKQGKYQLRINFEENTDRIRTIKTVRQILQLPIARVAKLLKDTSVIVISEGTMVEMQWLQELLLREKVKSIVEKK